jgi:hypothetical protein
MGINDEYSRDVYQGDHYVYDSDDHDDFDPELHPEDWQDMYSQELLDGWNFILEFIHDNFLPRKHACTYPKFVELVLNPNKFGPTMYPTPLMTDVWKRVRQVAIIRERVQPEQFYTWAGYFVF